MKYCSPILKKNISVIKSDPLKKIKKSGLPNIKSTALNSSRRLSGWNSVHPVNIVLVKYLEFFSLEFECGCHKSRIRIPETKLIFLQFYLQNVIKYNVCTVRLTRPASNLHTRLHNKRLFQIPRIILFNVGPKDGVSLSGI